MHDLQLEEVSDYTEESSYISKSILYSYLPRVCTVVSGRDSELNPESYWCSSVNVNHRQQLKEWLRLCWKKKRIKRPTKYLWSTKPCMSKCLNRRLTHWWVLSHMTSSDSHTLLVLADCGFWRQRIIPHIHTRTHGNNTQWSRRNLFLNARVDNRKQILLFLFLFLDVRWIEESQRDCLR